MNWTPEEQDYVDAISSVFDQFRLDAKVVSATRGPSVTRYEIELGSGVKVNKFAGLHKDIAYAVATESVRILAPIPGKSAVGIELPNAKRDVVTLDDVLAATEDNAHPLTVALGKTVDGELMSLNLGEMPHLLVAGTTGSGKSSFINSALVSLLKRTDPKDVRLLLIDPKMVELTPYDGVAHLLRPVVTEVEDAIESLRWLVEEMEERYRVMRGARARHIDGLGYPYIVCVVDELADLMMAAGKEVESLIVRLAQKARAAGIHLVLATQRPSVDVVTGLIKANVPSRLAFATSSAIDSRVVLDESGAEQLLGMGDGLFKPIGARKAIRMQAAYVSDSEIEVERAVNTPREEPQRLTPPNGLKDYLDQLIEYADDGVDRAYKYLNKTSRVRGAANRLELYANAPIEIGNAGTALFNLSEGLKRVRKDLF
jgi:S-DNA-T family DNA segregation ATPase FtsK/SpoIIIE